MSRHFFPVVYCFSLALFGGCANEEENDWFHDINGTDSPLRDAPDQGRLLRTITNIYHMPFISGETYVPSTYASHGDAWDFNLSGTSDCGEPVAAITDGVVEAMVNTCDACSINNVSTTSMQAFGNYVKLDHDADAYDSLYAHLDDVYVQTGQWVRQGQVIGTIGTTGYSTGCHLHLQVQDSGWTKFYPKFYYFDGSARVSGYLTANASYRSYNAGMFQDARDRNGGTTVVGEANPKVASRPAPEGFSKSFEGGSVGDATIYYQALGCDGGDGCPSYNNTNNAWLVEGNIRDYYYSCGGPLYCWLGFPTSDSNASGAGSRQTFEYGYVVESSSGTVSAYSY